MPEPSIIVRVASVREILELRHRILRAGLPIESAMWSGDEAPGTRHFAAECGRRVVGCATLMFNEWQGRAAGQVRGMAVEIEYRNRGVGAQLLAGAELEAAQSRGVEVIWCNARTPAVGFYRKQGWETVGDEFVIDTAGPHYKMVKELRSSG